MPEHPWERQQGESAKAFEACECYRMLGPDRSLQAAWERYYTRPGRLRKRQRKGEQQAGQFPGYWGAWATRWRWRERAAAWDDEVAALARDQELDRELKARMQEQEENLRQRQLMKEEARAARAVGRRILLRILQGVEAGQLEGMSVPDLLPHLQKASTLLEVGQKLERLELGEVTDRTEQRADPKIRKLAGRLEDLLAAAAAQGLSVAELEAVLDSLGNGRPEPEG